MYINNRILLNAFLAAIHFLTPRGGERKYYRPMVAGLLSVWAVAGCPERAWALLMSDTLVMSRLYAQPPTTVDADGQYIEIYNPTKDTVDLTGMQLEVNGTGGQVGVGEDPDLDAGGVDVIPPFGWYLVHDSDVADANTVQTNEYGKTTGITGGDGDLAATRDGVFDAADELLINNAIGTSQRLQLEWVNDVTIDMDEIAIQSTYGTGILRQALSSRSVVIRLPGRRRSTTWRAGAGINADTDAGNFEIDTGGAVSDSRPHTTSSPHERMIFHVAPLVKTVYMNDTFTVAVTAVGRYVVSSEQDLWFFDPWEGFDTVVQDYSADTFGPFAFSNVLLNDTNSFFYQSGDLRDTSGSRGSRRSEAFFVGGVCSSVIGLYTQSALGDTWTYAVTDSSQHVIQYKDAFCTGYAYLYIQTHAKARVISVSGGDTTTVYAGTRLYLQVHDTDQNAAAGTQDNVTVTVYSKLGGDTETWTLTEIATGLTGFSIPFRDTGTGLPLTASEAIGGGENNGLLYVKEGDSVFFQYVDATDPYGDTVWSDSMIVHFPSSDVQWRNGAATANADTYTTVIDSGHLQVTDPDANVDFSAADTIRVTVRNAETGDSLTYVLTENAAASGIFTAPGLPIVFSNTGPIPSSFADRILLVGHKDSITVIYNDLWDNIGGDGSDTSQDSATVYNRQEASGVVLYEDASFIDDVDTFQTRDLMYIAVFDTDENRDPFQKDTMVVVVRTGNVPLGGGAQGLVLDTESYTLTESTDTSGEFRSVAITLTDTEYPSVGDGRLSWGRTDTLFVRYDDVDPNSTDTSIDTAVAVEITTGGTVRFYWESDYTGVTDTYYTRSDSAYIEVSDTDENWNPQSKDTISVTVAAVDDQGTLEFDTETVILTESGETTGIFRSAGLPLSDRIVAALADGTLTVGGTDVIRV